MDFRSPQDIYRILGLSGRGFWSVSLVSPTSREPSCYARPRRFVSNFGQIPGKPAPITDKHGNQPNSPVHTPGPGTTAFIAAQWIRTVDCKQWTRRSTLVYLPVRGC